ncbi:ThuA domain-containing protein [Flavilitoribacter nigricans]|uniref:Uncharacterized protein n=1 Tax=Flavilitoribacter nigricans (strain ATCC 23147 / DSM 23189 / NBRC 102662 / NCIMB 1420 / SS-2) TaxID=1122177 RepID=A0A2D0N4H8_FLAN2|nr:ThuA domain-containing protein [Flavilitoribacter nigricans]PHN03049.1 hypothetical protein CRP01_28615 [Flavilitoribacter nigricans DSM 23189 = NBRC 102662]
MKNLLILLLTSMSLISSAQNFVLPLWPEGIPCENNLETGIDERASIGRVVREVHEPELVAFFPAEAQRNGTSVVICPGGGYTILAWDWEGTKMAEWYNSFGVTAFVVKYRLPHWESEDCRDKVALMDAQRAMRLVRSRAEEWRLDPERVGVMGFSAGGHLASTLSTHFDYGDPAAEEPLERFSCRPDFSVLMYPVVTMDTTFAHMGSRRNLIGPDPDQEAIDHFSNEKQVTAETPPAILIHADDDKAVVSENSVNYYLALRRHNIPASMHIFQGGGHGFSMAKGMGSTENWPLLVKGWMEERGLLQPKLKVLIVDGQNNHQNWPEKTDILKEQLEAAGIFSVTIARTPAAGEVMDEFQPNFSAYDVVVSNYNGDDWPEATRRSFEQYIRGGGGFVTFHAADNAFADWPAYNEMIGLGGWEGRDERSGPYVYFGEDGKMVRDDSPGRGGHHGHEHEFTVTFQDTLHPIARDLPAEWLHSKDELYDQLRGPARNFHVLATAFSDKAQNGTGRHEPLLMTIHYGEGRIFHTALGHAPYSMQSPGFIATLQRGTEWAATGQVTQEAPKDFQRK